MTTRTDVIMAERNVRAAVARYGTGDVATVVLRPSGGTLSCSDGRRFPVTSYADALTVARAFGLHVARVRSEV